MALAAESDNQETAKRGIPFIPMSPSWEGDPIYTIEAVYLVLTYRVDGKLRPVYHRRRMPYHGKEIIEFSGGAPEVVDNGNCFLTACREENEERDLERIFGLDWLQQLIDGYWDNLIVHAIGRIEPNGAARLDAHYCLAFVELPRCAIDHLCMEFQPTVEASEIILDPTNHDMSVTGSTFFRPAVENFLARF